MVLEILEEQGMDIEIVQEIPADMRLFNIPGTNQILLRGDAFNFLMQEFGGNGFSVWFSRFWTKSPTILRARGEIAFLELRIGIHNYLTGTWDKIEQPSLKAYEFNLSFTPFIETRAIFKERRHCATFDIHFELPFLDRLGFEYKSLMNFLNKVHKGTPAELSLYPNVCPLPMQEAIQFILKNPMCRKQPRLLETKVIEILLIALETVASPSEPLPFQLSPREIEGLHAIKKMIFDSFPEWPDPSLLCRIGEMNEFKLKVGFKQLFIMTAYEYHMQLKFLEAKKLLKTTTESISSIAYQIGYDHPSSFAKEFKKQFGCTASYFKKNGML